MLDDITTNKGVFLSMSTLITWAKDTVQEKQSVQLTTPIFSVGQQRARHVEDPNLFNDGMTDQAKDT